MKKITKKRKKEILHKNQEDMTAFEVLYAVPIGASDNMTSILNPRKLLDTFKEKPFSRRKMYALFNKQLTDDERLLISAQLKEIGERILMGSQIIENQLVER